MSRFDEELAKYQAQLEQVAGAEHLQVGFLENEAKRLGPNIYDADASLVACSDQTELDRIAKTFTERFGTLYAPDQINAAILRVCQKMSGVQRKYRAVFYFLLTYELGVSEDSN